MDSAPGRRKLTPAEAPALYDLQKKVSDKSQRIRSATQNLSSFSGFLDEADAMIAALPDGDAKEEWTRRKAHCQTVQTPAETAAQAAAKSLADKYQALLDEEKKKYGASLEWSGDSWTVEA